MDLDEILVDLGLGSYQVAVCTLIGLVLMYSNISPLSYAITASDLQYRCEIPQCDTAEPRLYNPDWLRAAVPFDKDDGKTPAKCLQYHTIANLTDNNKTCTVQGFDANSKVKCDRWVFADAEKTIVTEFNIMCEENKWKLTLVGTINSFGQLVGIYFSGYISDKYGRKTITIGGSILSSVFGILQSFTNGYWLFVLCEFSDSVVSSGVYAAALVLGLELVSQKSRVGMSTLMGAFYPLGAVSMGIVAYNALDWRVTLRAVYAPGILIFGCIWFLPESVRWLQSQNRMSEVIEVLAKVAHSNGKVLLPHVRESLMASTTPDKEEMSMWKSLKTIFGSRTIFFRLANCSFCWVTITLVYYGLSLTSVEFSGDKYINFILVNAIEIPSFFVSWYVMEKVNRRETQAFSFIFSGLFCIMVNWIPPEYFCTKLLVFLSSKFSICIAFNIMYVYTTEMFPTELRMSLVGITSMFGRIGSMIAPQMSLLGLYFGNFLPVLIFGVVSFVAGAFSFFLPETKDKKLPDTVKQAEAVGNAQTFE